MSTNAAVNKRSAVLIAAAISLLGVLPPQAIGATTSGGTAPSGNSHTGGPAHARKPSGHKSSRHVKSVRITSVKCVPRSRCSGNSHEVSTHGTLLLTGVRLAAGMTVGFPHARFARVSRRSPRAHLRKATSGFMLTVPKRAHSGKLKILLRHGRYTSSYGPITVVRHALHPPPPPPGAAPVPAPITPAPTGTAFEGQGMWIWYLSRSNGGDLASIVAQAKAAGVSTLFIKSSDGSSNYWSQFSPEMVATLHANGLRVCAWQYVYGTKPAGEAALGARAVADGADCLVIDAESQYEGHYGAAQTYVEDLRAKIGPTYPVGLASFPYVYYHTSLPYSVFLGPNGAQFNVPQMYWRTIGQSVDTVYANTYIANRVYGRPIFPLGQTYEHPSNAELLRFREEAVDYASTGVSWWDWQETTAREWKALAEPLAPLTSVTPNPNYTELAKGSRGDPVLWMQEHLASAIPTQPTTGIFDQTTATNLAEFQTAHGIAPTGNTEAATWQALLALPPVAVSWTGGSPKSV
jgi:peptidoglycan hydrolase-like protein with peptidoglycan-binding domain